MPRCSWEIRLVEVGHANPFSPFSVANRFGARPYIRGLLYCSATHSQKTDGFRRLSDLLGPVGNHSKSESGHIHFSILLAGPISHDARKFGYLGQPSTIIFPLKNYAEGFAIGRVGNGCHETSAALRRHSIAAATICRIGLKSSLLRQRTKSKYCGNYLCSKSTGAVTSCTRKYFASAGYFRATASYIA
jgi:hypothetical protein